MTDFRTLQVWHRSKALVIVVYRVSESFPKQEAFGMTSQLRRAAVSVPANIAEGCRRGHVAEFAQFIRIALGSLGELETYLELARNLGWILDPRPELEECLELAKMLHGLLRKYKGKNGNG